MAFVENLALLEQLLLSHEYGRWTETIYVMFNDLIMQRIRKFLKTNFDIHKDAMQVKCIEKLELIWQNYKFEQNNAFAYFVSVVDNVIKRYFLDNSIIMLRLDDSIESYSA